MSDAGHFNGLARLLHWAMAVMILTMLFVGVAMVTSLAWRPTLLSLHRPLGISIFVLALLRLGNRLRNPPPALPASLPRWQVFAAISSHWALYALMLSLPLIGWAMLSAGGYPVSITQAWVLPPIAPHDPYIYAVLRAAHGWLAFALFAVVLMHLAAALLHAWVLRDGVFQSMTRGQDASAARH